MFNDRSPLLYDLIYQSRGRSYDDEAQTVHEIVLRHARRPVRSVLDVACGTGGHLPWLARHYDVEGLDLNETMLAEAARKLPGARLHRGDMTSFDLGRRFDAVVCLFGSIGYTTSLADLGRALDAMARHVAPGGVLVVEPWYEPESYLPGTVHAVHVDRPGLKLTRFNLSRLEDGVSVVIFHYVAATPDGIESFTERHAMGLFTRGQMTEAFESRGFEVSFDPRGLSGRGLYVGCLAEPAVARGGATAGARLEVVS